jgi:hypothetical protein
MKNIIIVISSMLAAISLSAYADDTAMPANPPAPTAAPAAMTAAPAAPASAMTGPDGMKPSMMGDHPCKKIAEACEAAGFTKGGASGKGLMKDCLKPIMSGQSVQGVAVSPADVSACQAKRAAHH